MFDDAKLRVCEHTMPDLCHVLDVDPAEFNGEPDHVHQLVAYPPSLAISTLVNRLNGATARELRWQFTGRFKSGPHERAPLVAVLLRRVLRRRTLTIIKHIEQQQRPH